MGTDRSGKACGRATAGLSDPRFLADNGRVSERVRKEERGGLGATYWSITLAVFVIGFVLTLLEALWPVSLGLAVLIVILGRKILREIRTGNF